MPSWKSQMIPNLQNNANASTIYSHTPENKSCLATRWGHQARTKTRTLLRERRIVREWTLTPFDFVSICIPSKIHFCYDVSTRRPPKFYEELAEAVERRTGGGEGGGHDADLAVSDAQGSRNSLPNAMQ